MKIVMLLAALLLGAGSLYAQELKMPLSFPKKEHRKIVFPGSQVHVVSISDEVVLDVNPYPDRAEKGECVIRYYIDSNELHCADGVVSGSGADMQRSFKYVLDTNLFPDGRHLLTVNCWENGVLTGIGMLNVFIVNHKE